MDRLLVDFQSVVLYPICWLDLYYFIHVCAVCSTIGIFWGEERYEKSVHNYPCPRCAHLHLFALGPRIIVGVTLVLTVTANCEFLS